MRAFNFIINLFSSDRKSTDKKNSYTSACQKLRRLQKSYTLVQQAHSVLHNSRVPMHKVFNLILYITFLLCNGCKESTKKPAKRYDLAKSGTESLSAKEVVIDKDEEEGWGADLKISIARVLREDSTRTYFVNGLDKGQHIGFQIILPTNPAENTDNLAQLMTIKSIGEPSDNFLHFLQSLYNEKVNLNSKFVSSKRVAFIDLNEFAKHQLGQQVDTSPTLILMKIFFESDNQDDYAELYINISEEQKWIEIKEKDEEYRKQVLKGLTNL
jgi:hypothetical protein